MTLDAPLAAILFDTGASVEKHTLKIPLQSTTALWYESAAIHETLKVSRQAILLICEQITTMTQGLSQRIS